MSPSIPLCSLLALAFALPCPGQEPTEADTPKPTAAASRKLTREEVHERLEKVKETVVPKAWPDKVGEDPIKQFKYLKKWHAVVSDHYIIYTNGPRASCQKYAKTLEQNYRTIQTALPFEDLDHLMVAYIFKDPEEYYRFTVDATGWSDESARGTAGHATGAYYATYYQSPRDAVVFHEAAHQIVHACLKVPGVGSWFQEGIAVYFENVAVNARPDGSAKPDIRRGNYYPVNKLMGISSLLSDPNGHGRRNYVHAGSLLNFMLNTRLEPVAGKFEKFLAAARRGRGFARGPEVSEALIKEVYGLTVEEFEALWFRHLDVEPKT